MAVIKQVHAREILDSRGNPTVEVDVVTDELVAKAAVPSGASTGIHEAHELRDGGKRYGGKGVQQAVKSVNTVIAKKMVGHDCTNQRLIDATLLELDGSENKSNLGANALLAVSMAVCNAGAYHSDLHLYEYIAKQFRTKKMALPAPQLNIMNGGKHAGMENDIQEHMIVPTKFSSFAEAIRAGVEVYHELKKVLKKKYGPRATLLGDEGGFVPPVDSVDKRLDIVMDVMDKLGYSKKMKIALDCASSEFFYKDHYKIGAKKYTSNKLVGVYESLIKKYPITSIEDGMAEDDWKGWSALQKAIGNKVQLVGDDLLVTNVKRMQTAIEKHACNALLLKVNQIGTVSESMDAAKLATKNKWGVVVSHRSGETEDTFIADLCVGLGVGQSKFGAPARSERTAKYNRLIEIEQTLGKHAAFGVQ